MQCFLEARLKHSVRTVSCLALRPRRTKAAKSCTKIFQSSYSNRRLICVERLPLHRTLTIKQTIFLPQHLRDLCLSIVPWILPAFPVSLLSYWPNLQVMFQYILKWPSDPSMTIPFFLLSVTDRGLKAGYLTPGWLLNSHMSLLTEAFGSIWACVFLCNLWQLNG